MKRVIFVILIIFLLSYVVSATHISVEDFEDDTEFQDSTASWYTYNKAIGGNAGAWNGSVNKTHAYASDHALRGFNARTELTFASFNYSHISFYYLTNNSNTNGGWFRLYNGTDWSTDPIVVFVHFDDEFFYEDSLNPPDAIGMGIENYTWYKIDVWLNWTAKTCNFTVYNTSSGISKAFHWKRMYNNTQDEITMWQYRDSGGSKEGTWFDDLYIYPLDSEEVSAEELQNNALFVLGLGCGIVFLMIAGIYYYIIIKQE